MLEDGLEAPALLAEGLLAEDLPAEDLPAAGLVVCLGFLRRASVLAAAAFFVASLAADFALLAVSSLHGVPPTTSMPIERTFSIALSSDISSAEQNAIALPLRPARAVRPIRWT